MMNDENLYMDYLKSSISINTYIGCNNSCLYCIVGSLKKELKRVEKVQDEENAVNKLLNYRFFVKNNTVISINNRSDPFLNKDVSCSTMRILRRLEKEKICNPIILITKMRIEPEMLIEIDSMKLNIYFFYSYAALDNRFEKFTKDYRISAMNNLREYINNQYCIHYIRPIIEGYNSSEDVVSELLDYTRDFFDAGVVSGLRCNDNIINRLLDVGVVIDEKIYKKDNSHKILSNDTLSLFRQLTQNKKMEYKLFYHTSCAISYFEKQPDYNAAFKSDKCFEECPNWQRCYLNSLDNSKKIKEQLDAMGYNQQYYFRNGVIVFKGEHTQEELSYITHCIKAKCSSEKKVLSPSEKVLTNV